MGKGEIEIEAKQVITGVAFHRWRQLLAGKGSLMLNLQRLPSRVLGCFGARRIGSVKTVDSLFVGLWVLVLIPAALQLLVPVCVNCFAYLYK